MVRLVPAGGFGSVGGVPFTVSHIAAVVPFARAPLSTSALVVGSMSPDLTYFIPVTLPADGFGHTWVGILVVDPLWSLVVLALWWGLLARPVRAWLPVAARARTEPVSPPHLPAPRRLLLLFLCALLGAATHVLWDAFTHLGRWGTEVIPWLGDSGLFGIPGYKIAQYASGVIGLAIVLWWIARWYRRAEVRYAPGASARPSGLLVLVLIVASALVAAAIAAVRLPRPDNGVELFSSLGFETATAAGLVGGIVLVACAVVWQAVNGPRGRATSADN